jgi:DNA primase
VESGAAAPRTFTLPTMPDRITAVGDLWADIERHAQSLREPLAKVEALLTPEDWKEAHAASTRRPTSRKAGRK